MSYSNALNKTPAAQVLSIIITILGFTALAAFTIVGISGISIVIELGASKKSTFVFG